VTTNNDGNDGSSTHPSASQTEHHPYEGKLDFSPSSGAKGAEQKIYDATAPTEHDGRSDTKTTFNPTEGNDTVDYEHLREVNDGLYPDDNAAGRKVANLHRDLDIFTDVCTMDDVAQQRCEQLLERVEDGRRFQRDEVLLLATITFVANENQRRIRSEECFQSLRKTCNVQKSEIRRAREKLRPLATNE